MRRMVVTTARGHVVTDVKVTEEQLADGVARWMQAVPDCGVYVDGLLVSDEVRRAVQSPVAAPIFAPAPATPLEPERLRSSAEAMDHAFNGLCKGYLDLLRFTQEFAKQNGELFLERERRSVDEAARQRELTHKSLKDIDLLDRSVAATTLKDCLASASAQGGGRFSHDDRMRLRDLVMGAAKLLLGDKK